MAGGGQGLAPTVIGWGEAVAEGDGSPICLLGARQVAAMVEDCAGEAVAVDEVSAGLQGGVSLGGMAGHLLGRRDLDDCQVRQGELRRESR